MLSVSMSTWLLLALREVVTLDLQSLKVFVHAVIIESHPGTKRFMLQASGEPDAAEEGAGTGQKGSRPAFRDPETVRQLEHLQPGCCILSLRCSLHGAWAGSAVDLCPGGNDIVGADGPPSLRSSWHLSPAVWQVQTMLSGLSIHSLVLRVSDHSGSTTLWCLFFAASGRVMGALCWRHWRHCPSSRCAPALSAHMACLAGFGCLAPYSQPGSCLLVQGGRAGAAGGSGSSVRRSFTAGSVLLAGPGHAQHPGRQAGVLSGVAVERKPC